MKAALRAGSKAGLRPASNREQSKGRRSLKSDRSRQHRLRHISTRPRNVLGSRTRKCYKYFNENSQTEVRNGNYHNNLQRSGL